jgi:hypothetical protein
MEVKNGYSEHSNRFGGACFLGMGRLDYPGMETIKV